MYVASWRYHCADQTKLEMIPQVESASIEEVVWRLQELDSGDARRDSWVNASVCVCFYPICEMGYSRIMVRLFGVCAHGYWEWEWRGEV